MSALPLADPTRVDDDDFELRSTPSAHGRVLGAGVVASCVVAAARTLPPRARPVSVQVSFVVPGRVGQPLACRVHRLHDGRSSAVRQVVVTQDGRLLASVVVRFHGTGPGDPWPGEWPAPEVRPSPTSG